MTFRPENTLEPSLPENINFAEDQKQFLEQWTNLYRKITVKINGKERAIYPLELEILNSQRFFTAGNPQVYREVFRKVFNFGAIAAGGTLNIVHGLVGVVEYTRKYGTCVTAVVDYRPIPRVSTVNINQQISLDVVGVNIVIVNGAASPNITSGIIVLEYLKN